MKLLAPWLTTALLAGACAAPSARDLAPRSMEDAAGVVRALIAADNARDLAAALDCYAEEALWFPPGRESVRGRAAIADRYRELFARFEVHLEVEVSECGPVGDGAFVRGATHGTLRADDGTAPMAVDDVFVALLTRGGVHGWEIASLIWNPRSPGDGSSTHTEADGPATGFVDVEGGRVAYEVHGSGPRTPLLVLHGGPGIPHDYLQNLEVLGDERPVVLYDQLGCGRSDRPDDAALWTRERFAREIDVVREALGLDEVVLYGHSWGSLLAVDYLAGRGGARPEGVRGAILAGPALSIPRWMSDARRLIDTLPAEAAAAIREAEATGLTDSDAYRAATQEFYERYVCRSDPWPAELQRAFEGMGTDVYGSMSGPTEFTITGTLRDVDVTGELPALHLPLLFICGEYDEATPEATRAYAALAPRAETVVVQGAAHVANYDQPEAYMQALRGWLARNGL